jgi:restriction system protein
VYAEINQPGAQMISKSDLPNFDEYFVPSVASFVDGGGSLTIEEMEEAVAARMQLSDEILAVPHGDGPRTQFQYELAWVRTYLKKAGALTNSERAVWSLTSRGKSLTKPDILAIPKFVRDEDRKSRIGGRKENSLARRKVTTDTGINDEDSENGWKEHLLEALLEITPAAFERLCQRILRESGFIKVEVSGRSGDGGIDGTGVLRLNLLSFHVRFQSKRWRGSVGASVIRDFRGAMVGRADKGLIITTGNFTADARKEAQRDGAPAIDLIDGEALCDLMKSLKLAVTTEQVEKISVDPTALENF